MMIDLTVLTMDELSELATAIGLEKDKRILLSSAEGQIDKILVSVKQASGFKNGDTWAQPLGAHDSYPAGAQVTYAGKRWESLLTANVWAPGVSGWREVVVEGQVAAWVQPTGAHDAYPLGAKVTYNGSTWVSSVDANVWAPGVYGWTNLVGKK